MTGGLAAPIEKRLTDSEEKYKILSENLEEEVKSQTIQLQEAVEDLESFSYSVSHDLRSPLRGINSFSQALFEDHQDNLDDTGRDFLERILKNSDRMNDIITDLLDLSKISSHTVLNKKSIDISALAQEILNDLLVSYPDKKFNCDIQENLTVISDVKLIRIMLENLFSNALKFSAIKTAPKIEFGIQENNGTVVFFVKDNGVGFDMQYSDKLFNAFQRLHSYEQFEGTGIGLSIVKRIIKKLNGEVWAEGKVDEGATFYFTLDNKNQ